MQKRTEIKWKGISLTLIGNAEQGKKMVLLLFFLIAFLSILPMFLSGCVKYKKPYNCKI